MSVYSVNVYPSNTTIRTGNRYYAAYAIVNVSSNCIQMLDGTVTTVQLQA